LNIPKIGTLNVHPWLIPQYKWVMAYFWALKHNMNKAGVCVHWMDEWIDTWPIIAIKEFAVWPKTSQDKLMIKTALIWSILLQYVWTNIQKWKVLPTIPVDMWSVWYYSMPKGKDFRAYRWMRNFFSIRALWKAILRKTE
jgi:methionyl-tRNA formyltransferase